MTVQSRKHRGGLRLPPAPERLASKLSPDGECLVYSGNRTAAGYGVMTVDSKRQLAHRLAWQWANGDIPDGMVVRHKCDNPPCCNVDHLEIGTVKDNNHDAINRGRFRFPAPPEWRKIRPESLGDIIFRFRSGESKRSIAADYGVTRQAIHHLLKREGEIGKPE